MKPPAIDAALLERTVESIVGEKLPELEKRLSKLVRPADGGSRGADAGALEEILSEKLKALEAKLSGKIAGMVGASAASKSSSGDPAAIEIRAQEIVAER